MRLWSGNHSLSTPFQKADLAGVRSVKEEGEALLSLSTSSKTGTSSWSVREI